MKKNLLILIISALLIFFISIFRLSKELNEKKYEIEELNGNIDELTSELEDLKNQKISNSDYESDISKIYEMKIALLEEENKFEQIRSLRKEIFYKMIEDSDYENFIETTNVNYDNPKLNKVVVKIEGTDNILNFYSHLYSDYHWLYLMANK